MNQYDQMARVFADGQKEDWQYRLDMRSLLPRESSGKKILDLGCGTGIDLRYFAKMGYETYGIDSCQSMLNISRATATSATIVEGKFHAMPFADNFFDIVHAQYALQHEFNLDIVYDEIARVLRPGGEFIMMVPHPLFDFIKKNNKNYFKQEEYADTFFEGTVTIKQLSRRLDEYLSENLLKNFSLLKMIENYTADDFTPAIKDWIYPLYIAFRLSKRS